MFTAAFALLAALPVALWVVGRVAPTPALELALAFGREGSRFTPVEQSAAFEAWSSGVGLIWCGLSVAGLGLGIARPCTRHLVLPLVALLLLDATFGAELDPSRRDPHGAVRMLGIAALATAGALGVSVAIQALRSARIPFARAVSTLVVVYAFTLVFVNLEQSARESSTRELAAADAVTDEALASLPAHAALLLRSEPILLRITAWRLARGSRPDVLLVPMPLFERGGVQAEALAGEAGLVPLVRDMLLAGRPSEFALSALADARPLYVEPDLRWDPRLFAHLVPRPFFAEFAPHPLGRSDRRMALDRLSPIATRVGLAVKNSADGDPATRALLVTQLGQRAIVLAALGDRDAAREVVGELLALKPDAELGMRLKVLLDKAGRGPIDVGEPFAVR